MHWIYDIKICSWKILSKVRNHKSVFAIDIISEIHILFHDFHHVYVQMFNVKYDIHIDESFEKLR